MEIKNECSTQTGYIKLNSDSTNEQLDTKFNQNRNVHSKRSEDSNVKTAHNANSDGDHSLDGNANFDNERSEDVDVSFENDDDVSESFDDDAYERGDAESDEVAVSCGFWVGFDVAEFDLEVCKDDDEFGDEDFGSCEDDYVGGELGDDGVDADFDVSYGVNDDFDISIDGGDDITSDNSCTSVGTSNSGSDMVNSGGSASNGTSNNSSGSGSSECGGNDGEKSSNS